MNTAWDKSSHQRRSQSGLSLIELMIALVLGVVLTLGVTQVFLGSSKTYRTSDAVAFLQENMRFSLSRISRDVRMAGHSGCLVGEPEDHLDKSATFYNAALLDPGQGVIGWEAAGTGLKDTLSISGFSVGTGTVSNGTGDTAPTQISSKAVAGTDFIVLTGGERSDVILDGNVSGVTDTIKTKNVSGINKETILVAVTEDCSGGDRFQNTKEATDHDLKAAGNLTSEYTDDAAVYLFRSRGFYIGIGTNGEPALFRVALTPGESSTPVELVSGVENMQILYGVGGASGSAEQYVVASSVTDWASVVSVRVALLMRSEDNVLDESTANDYNLVGVKVSPSADKRARLVATTTIGVRNRLE
ncbi:MAG TPA: PilW family protein [Marinobacter sp.]|nr:PilW family protein [Marinobacter sp.]